MEDKIKDFDRTIEQRMNESEVAPPFGMWNRISAELETQPTPAPSVGSLVPRAALIGLITMAVLEAAFLVGYITDNHKTTIAYNTVVTTPNTVATSPTQIATTSVQEQTSTTLIASQISNEGVIVTEVKKATAMHKTALTAKPVKVAPAVAEMTDVNSTQLSVNNMDVTPAGNNTGIENIANNTPYYFPPVDIYTPAKTTERTSSDMMSTNDESAGSRGDEKKLKVSTPSEQKIRFKPPHRKKFHYGKIVRSK